MKQAIYTPKKQPKGKSTTISNHLEISNNNNKNSQTPYANTSANRQRHNNDESTNSWNEVSG
jgi:hypothetical protein